MKKTRRLHATEVDGRRRRKLCRHVRRENASGQVDDLTLALRKVWKRRQELSRPLSLLIGQTDASTLVGPRAIRLGPFAAIGKLV